VPRKSLTTCLVASSQPLHRLTLLDRGDHGDGACMSNRCRGGAALPAPTPCPTESTTETSLGSYRIPYLSRSRDLPCAETLSGRLFKFPSGSRMYGSFVPPSTSVTDISEKFDRAPLMARYIRTHNAVAAGIFEARDRFFVAMGRHRICHQRHHRRIRGLVGTSRNAEHQKAT
jgi:hypothetical protein